MHAMEGRQLEKLFRVETGPRFRLGKHKTDWSKSKPFKDLHGDELKMQAQAVVQANLENLAKAQELLYANDVYAVLIVLQAMDAAGKDGMIKHVMSGVNPQGCTVASFKRPTPEELDHDFLWRCQRHLPERGRIGIFNRSYYEEVLVVRVHPELLELQRLPPYKHGHKFWQRRYEYINHFERYLHDNGTRVLKFFLNLSKEEQKRRFLARLTHPEKHWKFNPDDLVERDSWDRYMEAYEDAIAATSTPWAPWYVIPADHKWIARAVVSAIIAYLIELLDLRPPPVTPERQRELATAQHLLLNE